jgi:hypothetical protein
MDAVYTGDRPAVQGEDHVSFSQTGPVGWSSRLHNSLVLCTEKQGLQRNAGALAGVDHETLKKDMDSQRKQDSHGRPG